MPMMVGYKGYGGSRVSPVLIAKVQLCRKPVDPTYKTPGAGYYEDVDIWISNEGKKPESFCP